MSEPNMLEHALRYAALGWKLLPVWWPEGSRCACPKGSRCTSPAKHPVNERGLSEATCDEAQIRRWFGQFPRANIGAMLRGSDLLAFDVDLYKGDGERLAAIEAVIGKLPDTIAQVSGSGEGLHAVYRAPREPGGEYVEIRGDIEKVTLRSRAYIVLAPSLHVSGKRYEWRAGHSPTELAAAELPAAWVDMLRRPLAGVGSIGVPPAELEPEWLRAIPDIDRERAMRAHLTREQGETKGSGRQGQAYNVARTCGRGFAVREPTAVYAAMTEIYNAKCRPPYPPDMIARRVESAYESAEQPEWGSMLKPADTARAELGLGARVVPAPAEPRFVEYPRDPAVCETVVDRWPCECPATDPFDAWPCDGETASAPAADDAWPSDLFSRGGGNGGAIGGFVSEIAGARADADAALVGTRAVLLVPQIREESLLPLIATPFSNVNAKIGGGLPVHSNNILVAPSGSGKSSFAGVFAAYHARHAPTIYYVGEMTPPLMMSRIIGQVTERSWLDVVRGRLTDEEMTAALEPLHLYAVKRQDDPMRAIRATVISAMADLGCAPDPDRPGAWVTAATGEPTTIVPLVIIDYVQLLASLGDDIRTATAQAVRDVQRYFEDTVAVGLTLSQASRDAAKRIREGVERAEDLDGVGAETAELERSATYQFVLSYQKQDGVEEHEVAFTISKGRFGGGSKLGLKFNGRTGRYEEMDGPPASAEDNERGAEIMAQVRIHADHQCMAGAGCGRPLTANSFSRTPHKVAGTKPKIDQALRKLESTGQIARRAGAIYLGAAAERDA